METYVYIAHITLQWAPGARELDVSIGAQLCIVNAQFEIIHSWKHTLIYSE